jgi:endogenous inhibitor of DNA gyrase (YacG/DUF329 family)
MKEEQPGPHDSGKFNTDRSSMFDKRSALTNRNRKTRSTPADPEFRCSQCGTTFLRSSSPCLPFCSIRCQRIDLGNWLDESYGLPIESPEDREYGTVDDDE